MTIFDQRYQKVMYQYNVNGTINFDGVQNRADLVTELQKLQTELTQAKEKGAVQGKPALDAGYNLEKAVLEAQKPAPDKKKLGDYLATAKTAIQGVAALGGLVAALTRAAELVQGLW